MQHIVRLESENVKRLRAVSVEPGGNSVVVVGGRNAQGKTSLLDSIEMALGGAKSIPDQPVRKGQKNARVVVETEEFKVTRTFTKKGSKLVVEGKGGEPMKSPQSLLDRLVGRLSFDPLGFTRMPAAQQATTLKELVGLDFTELDNARQDLYDERTEINRDMKSAESRMQGLEVPECDLMALPADPPSVSDLIAESNRINEVNAENARLRNQLNGEKETGKKLADEVDALEKSLAEKKAALKRAREKYKALSFRVARLEDEDAEEVMSKIKDIEAQRSLYDKRDRLLEAKAEVDELLKLSQEKTEAIRMLDEEREKRLAAADMPIDGLSFMDDGLVYNGVPFSQCSGAEQLRVSVAMGLALNPDLRVLLVRDGSLLDEDSMRMLAELAEKAQAQVWLERVGDGDECTVIIEDGEVVGKSGTDAPEKPTNARRAKAGSVVSNESAGDESMQHGPAGPESARSCSPF